MNVFLSHQTVGLPGFLDTDSSEINSLWQKELFNNQDSNSHDPEPHHAGWEDQHIGYLTLSQPVPVFVFQSSLQIMSVTGILNSGCVISSDTMEMEHPGQM